MNQNFLKLFFRTLRRNKSITIINVAGLVLGIVGAILVMQYVTFERSFDAYQKNGDRIYRVAYDRYKDGKRLWQTANSFYPTGKYLKEKFSEVENYTVIRRKYDLNISFKEDENDVKSFNEEIAYYASESIFDVFTFDFLQGNKHSIEGVNTVAISDQIAQKYFGNSDPVGRNLLINNVESYTITAVYKEQPANSTLKTDFLFSFSTWLTKNEYIHTNWGNDYFHSYIQLNQNVDSRKFAQKAFPQMIEDNYGESSSNAGIIDNYYLQSIRDIHLKSNIEYETSTPGNHKAVSALFIFSIFFLLIAWVNYANLSSAVAIKRAKEVGIKKANGVSFKALFIQFLSEAFIFNFICLILAILIVVLVQPYFSILLGGTTLYDLFTLKHLVYALLIYLFGVSISSTYPAMILSNYKPVAILKGKLTGQKQGIILRRVLITFQFVVSLVLITGTIIISKQVYFLLEKDSGINCQSKLIIKTPSTAKDRDIQDRKIKELREELLKHAELKGVSCVSDIPGREIENWYWCYKQGDQASNGNAHFRIDVDVHYNELFNLPIIAGRAFDERDKFEKEKIVVNLKSLYRIGFRTPEDAIGKFVHVGGENKHQIIGVVDDFHYKSVKVEAVPVVLTLDQLPKKYLVLSYTNSTVVNKAIGYKTYAGIFQNFFPSKPFEYSFLNENVQKELKPDKMFAAVFAIFSFMAIVIAIIGILGLMIVTMNSHMKELGVRKVMGAQKLNIFRIFFGGMIQEIVVAILIAIPIAYFAFSKWFLESYIYKIQVNPSYFIFPVLILILIIAQVVYFQTVRSYRIPASQIFRQE